MLISVIIPTYNEEKVISECVQSLKKQTIKDLEIIVVDDGSTDATKEIVKNLGVKLLEQNHQGPAKARNLGASHAKGKVFVFVDADMVFDKDFIKNLIKPILSGESKGTFSKEEYVANWNNVWARCWNINQNLPVKRRLPTNYPDHQKVFRAILKSEFDKVHGFSKGGYTDDYTLSDKLGYEAVAVPKAIFYHDNPESLSEVYQQAKWIAKREYKLGFLGKIIALFRASLPFSKVIGIYKSVRHHNFRFLVFKIVYDFGIFTGILEMIFTGRLSK